MDKEYDGPTRDELIYMIYHYNRNHPIRYNLNGLDISNAEFQAIVDGHDKDKNPYSRRIDRFINYLRGMKRDTKNMSEEEAWDALVNYTVIMNQETMAKRAQFHQLQDPRSAKDLQIQRASNRQPSPPQQVIRKRASTSQISGNSSGVQRRASQTGQSGNHCRIDVVQTRASVSNFRDVPQKKPSSRQPSPARESSTKRTSALPVAVAVIPQPQVIDLTQSSFWPPTPKVMIPKGPRTRPIAKDEKKEKKKEEEREERQPGKETVRNQMLILAHVGAQRLASEVKKY